MAKLSDREQKAKKAGGTLDYKTGKITVPVKTTRQAAAPLAGAGPLLNGQSRVPNSYGGGTPLVGAGPLLPGQTRVPDSYIGGSSKSSSGGSSSRALAASAKNSSQVLGASTSKPVTISPAPAGTFGIGRNIQRGVGAIGDFFSGLFGDYGKNIVDNSQNVAPSGVKLTDMQRQANRNSALGINNVLAADIPTGYGPNGEIFYNGNTTMSPLASDIATPGTNFSRPGSEQAYLRGEDPRIANNGEFGYSLDKNVVTPPRTNFSNPFGIATAHAAEVGNNDRQGNVSNERDVTPDELAYINQGIGMNYMNTIKPPADIPTATVPNRSLRGSGLFGNGGGIQGNDPYMQEMRNNLKGYGKQEKDVQNQFEDLIRALDPTYDQYKTDAKKGVDEELNQNLMKLAAVMNANNTGDSEQRAQLMSQQQGQALAKLADLMQKLNMQKQQDIQGYKTKSVDAVNSIREKQQNTRLELLKLMQAAQKEASKGSNGISGEDVMAMRGKLSSLAGNDGYVNPRDYAEAQSVFAQSYPNKASSFNALFPVHQYISPDEYRNIYGSSQQPISIDFGGYTGK